MRRALIDPQRCRNCQPCRIERECEMQAVFRERPEDRPWVDFYRCSGCLKCKAICPNGAVEAIQQPCSGGARLGW